MHFIRRKIYSVAIVISLLCTTNLFAESNNPELDHYLDLCRTQSTWLKAKSDWEYWKLEQLIHLRDRNGASWIETAKQKLKSNAAQARFQGFEKFVNDLESFRNFSSDHLVTVKESSNPILVQIPGSHRIVGWMEGGDFPRELVDFQLRSAMECHDRAAKKVAKLESKGSLGAGKWDKRNQLKLSMAKHEKRFHAQQIEYLRSISESGNKSVEWPDGFTSVNAVNDQRLESAVAWLSAFEAENTSVLELHQRLLDRESQRLAVLNDLRKTDQASASELNRCTNYVENLKTELAGIKKSLDWMDVAAKPFFELQSNNSEAAALTFDKVINSNIDYSRYSLGLRRSIRELETSNKIIKLELALLDEIDRRLRQAKDNQSNVPSSSDRFSKMLLASQEKEVASNLWMIETRQAMLTESEARLKILQREELRFKWQAVTSNIARSSGSESSVVDPAVSALLSSLLIHQPNDSSTVKKHSVANRRLVYVESGAVTTGKIDLLYSQSPTYPLGTFAEHSGVLNPIQLTNRYLGSSVGYRNVNRIGPNFSGSIRREYRSSGYRSSNRSVAAPSLYNSPYATNTYRQNQTENRDFLDRAYPFGILRSELRRFQTFGQPPWYLPGLRYDQLRNEYKRNLYGVNGSEILKSENYLDFTRPNYSE